MMYFHLYRIKYYKNIETILYLGQYKDCAQCLKIDEYNKNSDFQNLRHFTTPIAKDIDVINEIDYKEYEHIKLFFFRFIFERRKND